jgi:hypothetical protein
MNQAAATTAIWQRLQGAAQAPEQACKKQPATRCPRAERPRASSFVIRSHRSTLCWLRSVTITSSGTSCGRMREHGLLVAVGDAQRERARHAFQRAVVIAAAIAQPVALGIEAQARDQQGRRPLDEAQRGRHLHAHLVHQHRLVQLHSVKASGASRSMTTGSARRTPASASSA